MKNFGVGGVGATHPRHIGPYHIHSTEDHQKKGFAFSAEAMAEFNEMQKQTWESIMNPKAPGTVRVSTWN